MHREDGPFVTRLEREPGKRESRYAHLFCAGVNDRQATIASETSDPQPPADDQSRLARLEAQVEALQKELNSIKARLDFDRNN
jgi:uncharacterized protein YceH (UPF0502 family)